MTQTTVLVGVDGSSGSASASRWAAALATRWEAQVRGVHVLAPWVGWEFALPDFDQAEFERAVAAEVDRWMMPFAEAHTPYARTIVGGDPATVLMSEASRTNPEIIVVGAHGHMRWTPHLVGGVTSKLLHRTRWPVAVVPDPNPADEPFARGVVVGVDGSEPSRRALRWAVEHAHIPLSLVRVITTISFEIWAKDSSHLAYVDGVDPVIGAKGAIGRFVAESLDENIGARLVPEVVLGHAVEELTAAAETSSVLVVGASGHGAVRDLLLGSVARGCVARSAVPVVVVP